jgi:outer membrane protein
MKKSHLLAAAAATLALAGPVLAHADNGSTEPKPLGKGTLLVTLRASDVFSDARDSINVAGGGPTGLHVNVGNSVMPTLGITYFLTDHVSAEVILGSTQHMIKAEGHLGLTPVNLQVANTWVIPPVVTLQYRPLGATSRFSPYVGAGVNAMLFYNVSNKNGFHTRLNDSIGWAVQAGMDAPITDKLTLNVDVKKIFVTTHAEVGSGLGPLESKVHLDPWVISAGVGYRFF